MAKKHDIIWLDSVDSTNEEAKRHISDIDNLSVLSALEQTRGRGQRGNTWKSAPGENLMFSIVLKFSDMSSDGGSVVLPPLPARDQFILNEIASLSVVDFLSQHGISARIKWPNDIYAGTEKICGILIENSLRGSGVASSIIGIGLNINQRNFDVNLPNPTSMVLEKEFSGHSGFSPCHSERTEETFDIKTCLEEFMDIFKTYVEHFLSPAGLSSANVTISYDLRRLYLSRLWRLNEPSRFIDYTSMASGHHDGPMNIYTSESVSNTQVYVHEGRQFTGIILGLSPIGHLLVEDLSTGLLKEFAFKEIGYIL